MPVEKCKAGRGIAVGKHTFSLTMAVVTECAFCMHSWMNVVMTAFTAEFIAVLWGAGILLFFWDWPKRKTALLFQSNALRHILSQNIHRQPEAWEATLSLSPHRCVNTLLGKCVPSSPKSPAWEGPQPPELPVQPLRNSTVRTVFALLSSPNLSCCNMGLGNFP